MFKKIIFIIFIIIAIAILYYDRKINKTIQESETNILKSRSVPAAQPNDKPLKNTKESNSKINVKLTPEDPAKYGMVVYDKKNTPQTAEAWENQLKKIFEKQKTLESENAKQTLKAINTSEPEYQKQMQNIDTQIKSLEQHLQENPLDEKTKGKLQMLYKMKAVGNILKEKVVIPAEVPVQNPEPKIEPAKESPLIEIQYE